MKRSTFITWDQLKVGALILVSLAVLGTAVLKLGQAAQLFTDRYELISFLPTASGLRVGGGVSVAGQLSGTVRRIDFLPVDNDTTRNLRIVIEIDRRVQEQVRGNSRAQLRTLGLLGDKIFDISPGTPEAPVLQPGDTLLVSPAMDYEAVIATAAGAVDDMVMLTRDLRQITSGIIEGEGTMGQLLTNRELYDQLTGTLRSTNRMLVRLQNPQGTMGRMIDDPTLYLNLTSMVTSLDSLVRQVNRPEGTIGMMLADTTMYRNLVGMTESANSLMGLLADGDGTASRLLRDHDLYDQMTKAITDLNVILEDVRRNPSRYTRGFVNFKLF
jgi:phospholipid/cholesterol/gamma-HCH transport system substrate-binding protein